MARDENKTFAIVMALAVAIILLCIYLDILFSYSIKVE